MAELMQSLGLDKLPRDERWALAEAFWESVLAEAPIPLSEERRRELDRRIAEEDADPESGIPWEQVKADGRKKVAQHIARHSA